MAQPKPLTADEKRHEAKAYFSEWSRNAAGFLAAQRSVEETFPKQQAFLLHQATEALYHCALLTLTLYSPKSHRLKVLRSQAEGLDSRLIAAWPRDSRFSRRRFELLSRAYVEARYSSKYTLSNEELDWLVDRVKALQDLVETICRERLSL